MLRIAIALLLGDCSMLLCPELPTTGQALAGFLLLLVLATLLRSIPLGAFATGAMLTWVAGAQGLDGDLHPRLEGKDVRIRGHVCSLVRTAAGSLQFDLCLHPRAAGQPRRVRLTWYEPDTTPNPGEEWQFLVRMKRRHGFANPGGFDYEGALFREGVGAIGYVRTEDANVRLAPAGSRERLLQIRSDIAAALAAAASGDELTGVVQGLAVGVQDRMSIEQWRVFARTGTTHLMAISGLHVGMIAVVFAWLGGGVIVRLCPQHWRCTVFHGRAIGGITGAFAYAALAGMSIPTQRTLAMLCIYLLMRATRRPVEVVQVLSLTAVIVLLIDPFAPLAPGAWLSFLAVAAILCASVGRRDRVGRVLQFGRVQWAVTIGLLPVLIAAFGNVSLVSPLANVVAIPVFSAVLVPLVLVSAALSLVSVSAAHVVLQIPLWVLHGLWDVLEEMASWPAAAWHVPTMTPWVYASLAIGALALVLPGIWPLRLAAGLLCLPAFMTSPARPAPGELRVTVLDVGQGLSAVLQTARHTLVYDTGPAFRGSRDASDLVVLPFLRASGVRRVDMLMISHSDVDHAGGLQTFLREMPTRELLHGPSLPRKRDSRVCERGQRWEWDGVRFSVLHPGRHERWSDNDSSCVLLVQTANRAILLTGDIEQSAEQALVSRVPRVDLALVPHHGSRSSSTREFIARLRPDYAVVSAGYRNRWGFPKPQITQRWQAAGARVLTTAATGAIDVDVRADSIDVPRTYRDIRRRFWHWTE
jgi:competence protein ComEC